MALVFLNVDLDIQSSSKLDGLAAEMGDAVYVLYCGPGANRGSRKKQQFLVVESARSHKTPEAAIRVLCRAVAKLSPKSRVIWDAARKSFNLGYDVTPEYGTGTVLLSPKTLELIQKLGGELVFTCYQLEPEW